MKIKTFHMKISSFGENQNFSLTLGFPSGTSISSVSDHKLPLVEPFKTRLQGAEASLNSKGNTSVKDEILYLIVR